jgi:hypothetical protein
MIISGATLSSTRRNTSRLVNRLTCVAVRSSFWPSAAEQLVKRRNRNANFNQRLAFMAYSKATEGTTLPATAQQQICRGKETGLLSFCVLSLRYLTTTARQRAAPG